MLPIFASCAACFVIPLFLGVVALVPFRYHFQLSIFIHWLIFSIIIIYVYREYGWFGVIGGFPGIFVGGIMGLPALLINLWGTQCLLASLKREEDALNFVYPTFFAMGYSIFWLGLFIAMRFRIFKDKPGTNNWQFFVYGCLLTISPAVIAILIRVFNRKLT